MREECGEGVSGLSRYPTHTHTHFPRPLSVISFFESPSWQLRPVSENGESAMKAQRTGDTAVSGHATSRTTATSAGWLISVPMSMSENEREDGI